MGEYIEREAAIAAIMSEPPDAHYPHWYTDKINSIPAADVAPVRHGRWIPVTERFPESQNPVLVVAVSKAIGFPYIFKVAHINHHEITEDEYGWTDGEYDSEYDEENDCFWIPECWYECNAVEDNINWVIDDDYSITHWMPLPEPPKEVK